MLLVAVLSPEASIAYPAIGPQLAVQQAALEAECAARTFSGRAIVEVRGKRLLDVMCGSANRADKTPITKRTRFKLASVSKPLTALAVLQLSEQGGLGLDSPVTEYLPESPAAWSTVKVRHLLQHTSGIADQIDKVEKAYPGDQRAAVLGVIAELKQSNHRPVTEPGSKFDYSNFNYELLALIIERVSKAPFEVALDRLVLRPAGMKHAAVETGAAQRKLLRAPGERHPLAWGHVETQVIDEEFASVYRGSGGVFATADDMVAFGAGLAKAGLISPAIGRRLEAEGVEIQPGYKQALAGLLGTVGGERVWYQWGAMDGFRPYFARVEQRDLTVVVLTNLNEVKPNKVGEALVEAALADLRR